MAKDNKKLLLVAQEVKLVKILAGNNKKLRERTIKRLNKWLSDRSSTAPLTEDALMRIWKGLFYAMWMSDKPLIQEECAEKISNLIHLGDVKSSLLFFKCFLQTMVNEWYGIDQHRLDKFLMLVRRVFRQILLILHRENWPAEYINDFTEILNQTALKIDENTALGLCLHIDDIFLEELAKTSFGKIGKDKLLVLLQPFAQQLARVADKRQLQHIYIHIFKYLIDQTDVAINYREKFAAWKRRGFPGGSLDALVEIPVEEEDLVEIQDPEDQDDHPKDPRAGKVDVVLPQLDFDPVAVADLLEEVKYKKYSTSHGRKFIIKIVKQFKLLAEGTYPLGLNKIPVVEDGPKIKIKSSVKRLQNFEKSLTEDTKKTKSKALKAKKAAEFLQEQLKQKTVENNNQTLEEFIKTSEGHLFGKNNKQKNKNKNASLEGQNKRKLGETTKQLNKKQKIDEIPIKSQNHFKRNSGVWTVDEFEIPESPKPDKSMPRVLRNSEWEKPLKNGETEIFVVSTKSKKKLKRLADKKNRPISEIIDDFTQKMMNGNPNKKKIVKNPFSGNLTPKGEKKIKFSKEIQAQEFKEHQKQIINSPVIPYDASKKPTKSLLKPSLFSSPINPFYKKK